MSGSLCPFYLNHFNVAAYFIRQSGKYLVRKEIRYHPDTQDTCNTDRHMAKLNYIICDIHGRSNLPPKYGTAWQNFTQY